MEKMTYNKIVEWLVKANFQKKEKNKVIEVWYNPTLPDIAVTLMFNPKKN